MQDSSSVVMYDEIEDHIAAVEAFYRPLIIGSDSRLEGGAKLWGQFTAAVAAYHKHDKASFEAVIERVNELALARIILADPSLVPGKILYEPKIGTDDRRIDFVVPAMEGESFCLYIEAKTVRPAAKDSEGNWEKYQKRKGLHTKNVTYYVERRWLGAQIYGNSFSVRSKFMEYTRDFETRLAEAKKCSRGEGCWCFVVTGSNGTAQNLRTLRIST